MTELRIRERLLALAEAANLPISPAEAARLEEYFGLLAKWNATVNLTGFALQPPEDDALGKLLIEPLVAAPLIEPGRVDWVDLGSGGGSPAIPLKIVRPFARLMMVESKSRKAAFLREAVRTLGLVDVSVQDERFEELVRSSPPGSADVVTARAVRADEVLFVTAGHLLRAGGQLVLFVAPGRAAESPESGQFSVARRVPGPPSLKAELLCYQRER